MSSTATAAVPQVTTGNMFQFVSHSGPTTITYNLDPSGPLIVGQPRQAPTLSYAGPEGQLNFAGSQISQQDSPMGTLLSVVLKVNNDTGGITFSLFLPTVIMGDGQSQPFTTYGVKTYQRGFTVAPGAERTYEVERFKGTAELITLHAL